MRPCIVFYLVILSGGCHYGQGGLDYLLLWGLKAMVTLDC